jgi:invasion protein IalB
VGFWEYVVIRPVIFFAAVAGFVGMSAVASAQQTPAPAPAVQPATAQTPVTDPNQIVCKTLAPATGTRLGARRICQTQRQWDDQAQQQRDQLMRMQTDQGAGGGG